MSNETQLDKVRANLKTWLSAFNSKDIDTLVSLYDSEATYANSASPLMQGINNIKPWFEEVFQNMEGTLLYKEETAFIEGKMALLIGAYYFQPPEGVTPPEDAELTGRVALVYRQSSEGDWKLLFDMDNTPPDITPATFSN